MLSVDRGFDGTGLGVGGNERGRCGDGRGDYAAGLSGARGRALLTLSRAECASCVVSCESDVATAATEEGVERTF
eukprot:1959877-Pleurochrysis_carterae.AAC.1